MAERYASRQEHGEPCQNIGHGTGPRRGAKREQAAPRARLRRGQAAPRPRAASMPHTVSSHATHAPGASCAHRGRSGPPGSIARHAGTGASAPGWAAARGEDRDRGEVARAGARRGPGPRAPGGTRRGGRAALWLAAPSREGSMVGASEREREGRAGLRKKKGRGKRRERGSSRGARAAPAGGGSERRQGGGEMSRAGERENVRGGYRREREREAILGEVGLTGGPHQGGCGGGSTTRARRARGERGGAGPRGRPVVAGPRRRGGGGGRGGPG
jgi:hypothetical protein